MRRLGLLLLLLATLAVIPAYAQVYVTNSGFASNRADWQLSNMPLLNTPIVDLGSASAGSVGATNATAGNLAGASNATVPLGVSSSAMMNLAPVYGLPMVPAPMVPMETSANPSSNQPGQLSLGAASFNSAYDIPTLGGRTLAEVAKMTKERAQQHPTKIYTNDDIQKLKPPTNTTPEPAAAPANQG